MDDNPRERQIRVIQRDGDMFISRDGLIDWLRTFEINVMLSSMDGYDERSKVAVTLTNWIISRLEQLKE